MEIRNGIIFFDTKAEFEAYVSDANNVSITNYPVYIGDTKEIITHNVTYKDASEIDASQITSGTISVDRLPAGSLERCVVVANESARFALTTNDVQDGDTVKQSDTGVMYMVVDVNNLNSDTGYLTYTAVTNWESIANKPEFDYVKYSEQELTDEQKQIARENISVPTKVSELENDKNYLENGSGIIANGIYIYDTLGRFTLPENWDTSQNDLAVGVAVVHDHGAFVVAGDNNAYISKPTFGWAESVVWGSYGTDIPTLQNFETAENARSDFDGVNNTKKIVEALGENCAAYYATQFVFKNGKSGYLPSYGEAFVLSSNITEINTAFSVIGTELDRYSDTYLAAHTSTELNANECIISSFCYDFSEPNIQSKDCTSWFGNCQPTSHSDYYLGVLPFLHVEKEDLLIKTNGDGTNLLADDGEYKAIKTVNGESLLGEGNIDVEHLVEVTYEELFEMQCLSKLTPGVKYKLINYKFSSALSDVRSDEQGMDIVLTATSSNQLDENASVYFKMPCNVYTSFGDLKWDGRKEKCIEVYLEDTNEYYLCYYGGVYSSNTEYEPPYKYVWCIVGSNDYTGSAFFSDQRFIQPGDVLYLSAGSGEFIPDVTCVSEEKLYDIYYEGFTWEPNPEIYYYGCDKKYIWNNGSKENIHIYSIYSDYPDHKGVGVAKYNLINKEFEMDGSPLYYNGSLFGCLVEFSVDSETFQRVCWKIEANCYTLFMSEDGYMFRTDVTPEAPKDCLIGDKGIIWIPTHGGGMPITEGTIIDHVFHFRKDRGYISYMKDHAENEAWYDFKNALIPNPIDNNGNYYFTIPSYINFSSEKAIKNKILAPLSLRNMIWWGSSCNLIDYSTNVYLGGNGNIIKHSNNVWVESDNNYVLNSQNIESVAANNNKFEHCQNCILDGDGNYISNSENVNVIGSNNTILDSTGVTGKADKCVFKNANLTINASNSIRECLVTKCGDNYEVSEDIQSKIFWRSNNKTFILDPADIASDSILNSTF